MWTSSADYGEGRLVFLCLNPTQRYHRDFMREICERYMFAFHGRVSPPPDFTSPIADQRVRSYLGHLIDA
jgi:hypothetical protein